MSSLKQTLSDRSFVGYLHTMIEMTQEVSVMKMQKIRQSVLANRTYMDGLLHIFQHVKDSHQRELTKALEKRKNLQSLPETTKKSLAILLSPSNKFSGSLTQDVFAQFLTTIDTQPSDIVVVGEIGKQLFEQHFGDKRRYQYFALPNHQDSSTKLQELLTYILQYHSITVFTGRFLSLVTQDSAMTNISGYSSLIETATAQPKISAASTTLDNSGPEFLFEPSLDEIVTFFDLQVTASLFQQAMDESSLAHLGARIMALEASIFSLENETQKINRRLLLQTKHLNQKKQQQQLSSIRLWS